MYVQSDYFFDLLCLKVIRVEWSPHKSNLFASCSNDRRLNVWDITKIGQENRSDDAVDGPPELMVAVYI